MYKMLEKLRDKALDRALDWVLTICMGLVMWFIYSSVWAGWRAVAIGICVAIITFCVVAIYRRQNRKTSGDHQQEDTDRGSSDAEETQLLLGSWTVRKTIPTEPRYLAVWDFYERGRVVCKTEQYQALGKWRMEPTRVLVEWNQPLCTGEPCYDVFHRPIRPADNPGDSWGGWYGLNKLRATKASA
jgi:hypothetical protein